MNKATWTELIIELSNKTVTVETEIHPEWAKKVLSVAVHTFLTARYFNSLKEMEGKDIEASLLYKYIGTPEYDSVTQRYHINLTVGMAKMIKDRAIQYCGPKVGQENAYVPMKGLSDEMTLDKNVMQLTSKVFFRAEGSKRIVFKNIEGGVCEVLLLYVPNVDDLSDNDEVPVPSEYEAEVINLCRDFITGKKKLPDDKLADDNEEDK